MQCIAGRFESSNIPTFCSINQLIAGGSESPKHVGSQECLGGERKANIDQLGRGEVIATEDIVQQGIATKAEIKHQRDQKGTINKVRNPVWAMGR